MMASAMDTTPASATSDEDWLVKTAHLCLKSDPYEAKAWLITARTLFPRHFAIQFEAYSIEKTNKNIKESAKLLEEMFINFPQESQLWNEVYGFSEALQSDALEEGVIFLRELFSTLPASLQCHLLLRIADLSTDVLEQCRLMLLMLQRYPERVPDQGIKLAETLLATEKHLHLQTPLNPYRKYFACDLLPLVLSVSLPDVQYKQVLRWLQKAVEFYITYMTQPPNTDPMMSPNANATSSQGPELLSPTSKKSFLAFRRVSIPGLSEKEALILQPWEKLFTIVQLASKHLKWSAGDLFSQSSRELQWQAVYGVHQSSGNQSSGHRQVIHLTTLLFLHCLYNYSSRVDPLQFVGSASLNVNQEPLVMIEGFKAGPGGTCSPPRSKKARLENSAPPIHASKRINGSQEIVDSFKTALKCWELLHTPELEKEFNKLLHNWRAHNWTWLKSFEIDLLIYQGHFRDAVNKLVAQKASRKELGLPPSVRSDLQTACCYYCLGNFSKASECVLAVVEALPVGSEPAPQDMGLVGSGRQVQLLTLCEAEVLPYCIHLMITCFREKAFKHLAPDDMSLGHMVVLLQYDWPRYEVLFAEVLTKIQKMGSFTYSPFFNYVTNIDMLEEFAFLRIMDNERISLDILPTSTKTLAQQRTVTRGVNKGVKEDFKIAMEKQVARSNENMEAIIRKFLQEEKEMLQQNLL